MEYRINDIVRFEHSDSRILTGIIESITDQKYYIKGNDTKNYITTLENIIESVGRFRINEVRAKAEEWEKAKRPLFNRPKYD